MKLTKENIQFIDSYLQAAGVIHIDLRVEMIDHVASEIENRINNGDTRDFYYVFKDYMVQNKKRLLKSNKSLIREIDITLYRQLLYKIFSWQSVLIFLIAYTGAKYLLDTYGIQNTKEWVGYAPFISFIILFIIFWVLSKLHKYQRISVIERLIVLLVMIFNITHLATNMTHTNFFNDKPMVLLFVSSLGMAFLTSVVVVFHKIINENKQKIKLLLRK